jgi:hypothetical protein
VQPVGVPGTRAELGGDTRGQLRIHAEPRDFVLVLVRHELVEIADHGGGEFQPRADPGFGLPHPPHQLGVIGGIGRVLVSHQILSAAAHQRLDAGQIDGTLLAAVAILEAELRTGTGRHRTHADLHLC